MQANGPIKLQPTARLAAGRFSSSSVLRRSTRQQVPHSVEMAKKLDHWYDYMCMQKQVPGLDAALGNI